MILRINNILYKTDQMFTDLKKNFHQQIERSICNEITYHNINA